VLVYGNHYATYGNLAGFSLQPYASEGSGWNIHMIFNDQDCGLFYDSLFIGKVINEMQLNLLSNRTTSMQARSESALTTLQKTNTAPTINHSCSPTAINRTDPLSCPTRRPIAGRKLIVIGSYPTHT
jgi:hypothetical protein